jgi:predicted Ser/Thr protein kinase
LRLASPPEKAIVGADAMLNVKDTLRATVRLSFDGRVFKTYHGPKARKRFENEVRVLRHLEARRCGFVPRLLEADPEKLHHRHHQLRRPRGAPGRAAPGGVVRRAGKFGVRHDDPDVRNVTYRIADGRFCIIDFEFATILPDPPSSK